LTAVVALLTGSFDETELRVVLTSIGFAVSSSTAAAGAAQRCRASGALRRLGAGTIATSALAFVLLVIGLWTDDYGSEAVWRAFGCVAVLALAGSHACLVLGARRASDRGLVSGVVISSLALGVFDALASMAPISGLVEEVDEGLAKVLAASLVLFVLTSVLPPILRRLQPAAKLHAAPPSAAPAGALELLTGEMAAIADRIDGLTGGPANRAPEIRREVERLRKLAETFRG